MSEPSIGKARYSLGRVQISIVNMDSALALLADRAQAHEPGYVCVANRRTVLLAQRDREYCHILNNSLMTLPDGMPLVWLAWLQRIRQVERVTGPDLMLRVLARSQQRGFSHYFLGDTADTLARMLQVMTSQYPGIEIKGTFSPPFRDPTNTDISQIAAKINETAPSFVWIALGAPKQERLMAALLPNVRGAVLVGVGAAFRFMTGEYRHPPKVLQMLGLEGFCWRFRRAPIHYTKRYLVDGLLLLQLALRILLRRSQP